MSGADEAGRREVTLPHAHSREEGQLRVYTLGRAALVGGRRPVLLRSSTENAGASEVIRWRVSRGAQD